MVSSNEHAASKTTWNKCLKENSDINKEQIFQALEAAYSWRSPKIDQKIDKKMANNIACKIKVH